MFCDISFTSYLDLISFHDGTITTCLIPSKYHHRGVPFAWPQVGCTSEQTSQNVPWKNLMLCVWTLSCRLFANQQAHQASRSLSPCHPLWSPAVFSHLKFPLDAWLWPYTKLSRNSNALYIASFRKCPHSVNLAGAKFDAHKEFDIENCSGKWGRSIISQDTCWCEMPVYYLPWAAGTDSFRSEPCVTDSVQSMDSTMLITQLRCHTISMSIVLMVSWLVLALTLTKSIMQHLNGTALECAYVCFW